MRLTKCKLIHKAAHFAIQDMESSNNQSNRTFRFACPACGEFVITYEAEDAIRDNPETKHLRYLISAATRRSSESGEQPLLLKSNNWRSQAEAFQGVSLASKMRTLLEILRKKSDFFGEMVEFTPLSDWPLLIANGPEEAAMILQTAFSKNLIVRDPKLTPRKDSGL